MKTVVLGGEGGDKVYGKHSEDPFHPKSIWSAGENQSDLLEKVSLIWWTLCELLSNHYCTTLKRLEIDMKHIWNKYEITLKQIWNIQTTMKHLWNKCKTNTGQIWNRKNALVALSCLLDWEANGGSREETRKIATQWYHDKTGILISLYLTICRFLELIKSNIWTISGV